MSDISGNDGSEMNELTDEPFVNDMKLGCETVSVTEIKKRSICAVLRQLNG